jgi:hypothetical protein
VAKLRNAYDFWVRKRNELNGSYLVEKTFSKDNLLRLKKCAGFPKLKENLLKEASGNENGIDVCVIDRDGVHSRLHSAEMAESRLIHDDEPSGIVESSIHGSSRETKTSSRHSSA